TTSKSASFESSASTSAGRPGSVTKYGDSAWIGGRSMRFPPVAATIRYSEPNRSEIAFATAAAASDWDDPSTPTMMLDGNSPNAGARASTTQHGASWRSLAATPPSST